MIDPSDLLQWHRHERRQSTYRRDGIIVMIDDPAADIDDNGDEDSRVDVHTGILACRREYTRNRLRCVPEAVRWDETTQNEMDYKGSRVEMWVPTSRNALLYLSFPGA